MTKSMTKSMTKWGNDKVYPPPFIVQECLRHSADPLIRAFRCLLGADRRHSLRVFRQKRKKTLGAAGGRQKAFSQGSRIKTQGKKQKDRRHSLRVRALKRREKNKKTEGILSGFV